MVLQNSYELKNIFKQKFYNDNFEEIMNLNNEYERIINAFNKIKNEEAESIENLKKEKNEAIKNLDIVRIKQIENKIAEISNKN